MESPNPMLGGAGLGGIPCLGGMVGFGLAQYRHGSNTSAAS